MIFLLMKSNLNAVTLTLAETMSWKEGGLQFFLWATILDFCSSMAPAWLELIQLVGSRFVKAYFRFAFSFLKKFVSEFFEHNFLL